MNETVFPDALLCCFEEELSGIYLVEPMRLTTTVVKFSGTLGSTTCSDLRSLTVTAFAHYVAEQTACRYVFVDIQGVLPASLLNHWLNRSSGTQARTTPIQTGNCRLLCSIL